MLISKKKWLSLHSKYNSWEKIFLWFLFQALLLWAIILACFLKIPSVHGLWWIYSCRKVHQIDYFWTGHNKSFPMIPNMTHFCPQCSVHGAVHTSPTFGVQPKLLFLAFLELFWMWNGSRQLWTSPHLWETWSINQYKSQRHQQWEWKERERRIIVHEKEEYLLILAHSSSISVELHKVSIVYSFYGFGVKYIYICTFQPCSTFLPCMLLLRSKVVCTGPQNFG